MKDQSSHFGNGTLEKMREKQKSLAINPHTTNKDMPSLLLLLCLFHSVVLDYVILSGPGVGGFLSE